MNAVFEFDRIMTQTAAVILNKFGLNWKNDSNKLKTASGSKSQGISLLKVDAFATEKGHKSQ